MSTIPNGVGEAIPDEMEVFVTISPENFIERVSAQQTTGGPFENWPEGLGAKVATLGAAAIFPFSVTLDPGTPDKETVASVRQQDRTFILMDCGRWGGPMPAGGKQQRCFGLVWGPWSALCEYVANDSCANNSNLICKPGTTEPLAGHPINELLVQLRGSGGASIRLIKAEWSPTAPNGQWTVDWATIFLVLPDLHLPISIRDDQDITSDGSCTGRFEYCAPIRVPRRPVGKSEGFITLTPDDEGFVVDPDTKQRTFSSSARTWFRRYRAGDIFGPPSGSAVRDLLDFCRRINAAAHRSRIHFIQLGDMYDLWIGLDAFFSEQSTQTVVLKNQGSLLAGNFIDFWCNRTNQIFDDTPIADPANPGQTVPAGMLKAINGLQVKQKSFLWGNHDNYLAAHTPGGIPQRQRDVRINGVFIDHGQRYDPSNRDGTLSGQHTTNDVFANPIIRSFDPTRRGFYTSGATSSYLVKPDFGTYVMGHTHSPFLTRVRIHVTLRGKHPPPGPPI